jgi:Co/Zn/Cd efflux system component
MAAKNFTRSNFFHLWPQGRSQRQRRFHAYGGRALVSVGVVVAGLAIVLTRWLWLDPTVSLAINAIIVWGTWSLLRDSTAMSLNAVPAASTRPRSALSSEPDSKFRQGRFLVLPIFA